MRTRDQKMAEALAELIAAKDQLAEAIRNAPHVDAETIGRAVAALDQVTMVAAALVRERGARVD